MNPPYIHITYPYHHIIPPKDNQHLSEAQLQSHPFRSRKDHPLFYDGLHRGRCSHGLLHGRTLGITLSRCHGGHLEPQGERDQKRQGWLVIFCMYNMIQHDSNYFNFDHFLAVFDLEPYDWYWNSSISEAPKARKSTHMFQAKRRLELSCWCCYSGLSVSLYLDSRGAAGMGWGFNRFATCSSEKTLGSIFGQPGQPGHRFRPSMGW